METKHKVVREAVGIFPDDKNLMAAIDELEQKHFARQDISVVGDAAQMRRVYDSAVKSPHALLGDSRAPRGVFVMPEEQSLAQAVFVGFGALMGVVAAMAFSIGARVHYDEVTALFIAGGVLGGLVGLAAAIVQTAVRRKHIAEQINKGGLPLWVNTSSRERESLAQSILAKYGARDVHIQQVVLN